MEIFRLDKAIDKEKLDLEMAIAQLKKAKEQLSQSLKRRKDLAIQMNMCECNKCNIIKYNHRREERVNYKGYISIRSYKDISITRR